MAKIARRKSGPKVMRVAIGGPKAAKALRRISKKHNRSR